MSENRIHPQPEYDALHAFDAENSVEPQRVIAERIVKRYWAHENINSLVDDIAHAIEDARELGQRRAKFIPDQGERHNQHSA